MPRNQLIQFRRDTAANWTSVNPILAEGEFGVETDTLEFKIGDGSTAWVSLAYATGGGGALSDGDKGDITVSGSGAAWAVDNDAITFDKMQNIATDKLIGRDTASSGDPEELAVGGGLEFTGSGGIQRSALTGDVTATAGSGSTIIANDAVTYAKMQNVSATDKLLGRSTSGAGDVEEIACTAAGRALIDDADASAQRTTLELGTLSTQNGTFSGTSSGTNTGDQDLSGYVPTTRTVNGHALSANVTVTPTDLSLVIGTDVEAHDADLTTIAGLTPTNDDVLQRKAGAWINRTIAQLKTDLSLSGTNTGDQTSVSGNAGTATALQTARNIDGQSFDGSADITVIAPGAHAATSKVTPVDADELPLVDSASSNVLKKLTWANLKATAKTYFDGIYATLSHTHSTSDITSGSLTNTRQTLATSGSFLIAPVELYQNANVSCTVTAANDVVAVAFVPKETISVLSVHFDVQTLFSGGLCSVGVYDAPGTTLLISSGAKSTTSTGAQSATLGSAVTLYANTLYWLAYTIDNTTAAVRGATLITTGIFNVLNAGTVQMGKAANASTSGVLPSSLGAITGSNKGFALVKLQG